MGKSLEEMIEFVESLPDLITRDELDQILGADQVDSCLSDNTKNSKYYIKQALIDLNG